VSSVPESWKPQVPPVVGRSFRGMVPDTGRGLASGNRAVPAHRSGVGWPHAETTGGALAGGCTLTTDGRSGARGRGGGRGPGRPRLPPACQHCVDPAVTRENGETSENQGRQSTGYRKGDGGDGKELGRVGSIHLSSSSVHRAPGRGTSGYVLTSPVSLPSRIARPSVRVDAAGTVIATAPTRRVRNRDCCHDSGRGSSGCSTRGGSITPRTTRAPRAAKPAGLLRRKRFRRQGRGPLPPSCNSARVHPA